MPNSRERPTEAARAASQDLCPERDLGLMIMTEPDKKDAFSRNTALAFDGLTRGQPRGAVCLAAMYCDAGQSLMARIASSLKSFWTQACSNGTVSRKPWMSSVSIVLKAMGPGIKLEKVCANPFTFCPLPRWLQTWDHDGEEEKFDYPIPSEATIREQSAVLNLWGRQWSPGLANEIQSIALGILEERISGFACGSRAPFASIDPYCSARSAVKCCMPKLVETFCAFVPASITHKTVGDALMLVGVVGDRDVMKVLGGKPAHRTCVCCCSWPYCPSI